jgi:SNF2 family DNA or RNA helicase
LEIWNHPDILYDAMHNTDNGKHLHTSASTPALRISGGGLANGNFLHDFDDEDLFEDTKPTIRSGRTVGKNVAERTFEWVRVPFLAGVKIVFLQTSSVLLPSAYTQNAIENGYKMAVALQLIKHSVLQGHKILLYSQSLKTLDVVESLLAKTSSAQNVLDQDYVIRTDGNADNNSDVKPLRWFKGKNYFRRFLQKKINFNLSFVNKLCRYGRQYEIERA